MAAVPSRSPVACRRHPGGSHTAAPLSQELGGPAVVKVISHRAHVRGKFIKLISELFVWVKTLGLTLSQFMASCGKLEMGFFEMALMVSLLTSLSPFTGIACFLGLSRSSSVPTGRLGTGLLCAETGPRWSSTRLLGTWVCVQGGGGGALWQNRGARSHRDVSTRVTLRWLSSCCLLVPPPSWGSSSFEDNR